VCRSILKTPSDILKTPSDPRRELATTTLELIGIARATLRFPEDSAAGHPMRRELLITRVEERIAAMGRAQRSRIGNEARQRKAAHQARKWVAKAREIRKHQPEWKRSAVIAHLRRMTIPKGPRKGKPVFPNLPSPKTMGRQLKAAGIK